LAVTAGRGMNFPLRYGEIPSVLECEGLPSLSTPRTMASGFESPSPFFQVRNCWLFWLVHAHEYEPEALAKLLPQPAIRQATETLARIAEITEDKAMYDARERAIRDRKSEIYAAVREGEIKGKIEGKIEGEIKGKIEMIQMLQGILRLPASEEQELRLLTLEQLQALTSDLQEKLRSRTPS